MDILPFYGNEKSGGVKVLILITYDVNTETTSGKKRLRDVAKCCVKHGQRVQNSVFECILDRAQYVRVRFQLSKLIDPQKDSLRFYNLGNHYANKVEHIGAKDAHDMGEPLIF